MKGEYHANLLKQLQKDVKTKWPAKVTKGVLFHWDNALAHKSVVAMAALHGCGFTSRFVRLFLFTSMKKHLAGRHNWSDEEFFRDQAKGIYTTGTQGLQHLWRKSVDRKGDNVEKTSQFLALENNKIMVRLKTFQPTLVCPLLYGHLAIAIWSPE